MSKIKSLKTGQVVANQNALNIQTKAWQGALDSWMNTGKSAFGSYAADASKRATDPALAKGKIKPQQVTGRVSRNFKSSYITGTNDNIGM